MFICKHCGLHILGLTKIVDSVHIVHHECEKEFKIELHNAVIGIDKKLEIK